MEKKVNVILIIQFIPLLAIILFPILMGFAGDDGSTDSLVLTILQYTDFASLMVGLALGIIGLIYRKLVHKIGEELGKKGIAILVLSWINIVIGTCMFFYLLSVIMLISYL